MTEMKAYLYICNDTFVYNGTDNLQIIKSKFADFQKMIELIGKYHEDNILHCVKEGFLSTPVFPNGVTIQTLVDNYTESVSLYGKEIITLLYSILSKRCLSSKISLQDMKEYLLLEDETQCNAILVLNKLDEYEEHLQVLSNQHGWFKFRRCYLAKYPQNAEFFLDESKKYFPNLNISESTKSDLQDVVNSHPKQIVHCLSLLNDNILEEYKNQNIDIVHFLPWFKSCHKLDDASLQGKKDVNLFTFKFKERDVEISHYCEPHLKMYKDDNGNDGQHCRIYFKNPVIDDKVVYVGYIGIHL